MVLHGKLHFIVHTLFIIETILNQAYRLTCFMHITFLAMKEGLSSRPGTEAETAQSHFGMAY
jgi:hypothetical protein